jgi:phage host-nuclease inhibitor protein Gam
MDVNALVETAEMNQPAEPLGVITGPPELQGYEDEESGRTLAWRIEDLASADWALRRLAECEAEIDEIVSQAAAAVKRIEERRDALTAKEQRGGAFFHFKLTEYAERKRGELLHGKKKSREFLHGKIAYRTKPERLEVTDPAALEAWLLAQPVEAGLYRMKVSPEMRALQDRFKTTGEVPPGMDVVPESESITVEAVAPERALED